MGPAARRRRAAAEALLIDTVELVVAAVAAAVTLGIAVGGLLQRAPPHRAALLLPGAVLSLLGAVRLLALEPGRGAPYLVHEVVTSGFLAITWFGAGSSGTPGLVAPAVALRPPDGEAVRPTPGRSVGMLAAAVASSVPFWIADLPQAGLIVTFPAGVVLLALRSSPGLDRARADAAAVQLVGGVSLIAGLTGAMVSSMVRYQTAIQPSWVFTLALPPLALAVAASAHVGRPSRSTLAGAAAPVALVAALLLVDLRVLGAAERQLRALGAAPAVSPGPLEPLPIDPCFCSFDAPACSPGTSVRLDTPEARVLPELVTVDGVAIAAADPSGGVGIVRVSAVDPLQPPSWTILPVDRRGDQVYVGDPPAVGIDAIATARSRCGWVFVAYDPGDTWTVGEVVGGCPREGCVFEAPGSEPRCGWDDTLGWAVRCPTSATCAVPPGGTARCEGTGCTLEVGAPWGAEGGPEGGAGPARLLCPGGGCTLIANGAPVAVACPGRCTLNADPSQVTCLEGDCSVP